MSFHDLISSGSCSALTLSADGPVRTEPIPWIENLPRQTKRKIGRLTLLMYSAVYSAVHKLSLPAEFPLVVGTAYGEIDTGIDVITDIFESRGTTLRPIKVQNSVHVASAGHLGILLGNMGPTLTVSQGKLTAEASLRALSTLIQMGDYPLGIMVVGDLFNPEWALKLMDKAPEHYQLLVAQPFYEGAVALVLGQQSMVTAAGASWEIGGGAFRCPPDSCPYPDQVLSWFNNLPDQARYFTRAMAPWSDDFARRGLSSNADHFCHLGPGAGTSMTGPLHHLVSHLEATPSPAVLYLAREDDEIGIIRCNRLARSSTSPPQP